MEKAAYNEERKARKQRKNGKNQQNRKKGLTKPLFGAILYGRLRKTVVKYAGMAELADARDLKSRDT